MFYGVITVNDFERIGRELERQGKAEKLKTLAESDEGKAISRMVDAETVQKAAMSGDAAALKAILSQVLATNEVSALRKT